MSPRPRDRIVLATGTAIVDAGLLQVLVSLFEAQTDYRVHVLPVGSGKALKLGARGEADLLLVHAGDAELAFMAAGHGLERVLVVYGEYVVVGPPEDPAGVRRVADAVGGFKQIARSQALWLSRGDDSGTYRREEELWQEAGVVPKGPWFRTTGEGMGVTLRLASRHQAYTLSPRATFLWLARELALEVHVAGDPRLDDAYHAIVVNPGAHPEVNVEGARAFVEFLLSPQIQDIIRAFGVDEVGEPLFTVSR